MPRPPKPGRARLQVLRPMWAGAYQNGGCAGSPATPGGGGRCGAAFRPRGGTPAGGHPLFRSFRLHGHEREARSGGRGAQHGRGQETRWGESWKAAVASSISSWAMKYWRFSEFRPPMRTTRAKRYGWHWNEHAGEWGSAGHHTRIGLRSLDVRESEEVVKASLRADALPEKPRDERKIPHFGGAAAPPNPPDGFFGWDRPTTKYSLIKGLALG